MRHVVIASMCIALLGCAEPTLDSTSEAAFKASIEKIVTRLPVERAAQLREDIGMLAMHEVDLEAIMSGKQTDVAGDMMSQFNGKTADQVMEHASKVRAERELREREQALAEIQELLGKQQQAEEAKRQLAEFKVTRSRFYKRPQTYGRAEPIIELDVTNGTSSAISRAYFRGRIASPGRQVPWLNDIFSYEISGGLEPRESVSWVLAPARVSDWGRVEAPEDAVFTVEAYKLDGPGGETLFDASGLSEYEQTRLAKLRETFGD